MRHDTAAGSRSTPANSPGGVVSTQMSAASSKVSRASRPASSARSIVTLRLFVLRTAKKRLVPSWNGGSVRDVAPVGGSTRMTSAPKSASNRPQSSAFSSAMSTTRRPRSGSSREGLDTSVEQCRCMRAPPSAEAEAVAGLQIHQQQDAERERHVFAVEYRIRRRREVAEPDEDVQQEPSPAGDSHEDAQGQRDTEAADREHPPGVVDASREPLRDPREWTVQLVDIGPGR